MECSAQRCFCSPYCPCSPPEKRDNSITHQECSHVLSVEQARPIVLAAQPQDTLPSAQHLITLAACKGDSHDFLFL